MRLQTMGFTKINFGLQYQKVFYVFFPRDFLSKKCSSQMHFQEIDFHVLWLVLTSNSFKRRSIVEKWTKEALFTFSWPKYLLFWFLLEPYCLQKIILARSRNPSEVVNTSNFWDTGHVYCLLFHFSTIEYFWFIRKPVLWDMLHISCIKSL